MILQNRSIFLQIIKENLQIDNQNIRTEMGNNMSDKLNEMFLQIEEKSKELRKMKKESKEHLKYKELVSTLEQQNLELESLKENLELKNAAMISDVHLLVCEKEEIETKFKVHLLTSENHLSENIELNKKLKHLKTVNERLQVKGYISRSFMRQKMRKYR